MTTIKRLPSAELNIMLVLWKTDKPVTAAYVMNQLKESQQKQLAITSVLTLLTRLSEKGFVEIDKSAKANLYSVLISEAEYSSKSVLEKFYGNSLTSLVSSLVNDEAISKQDINDLRDYLNNLYKED